MNADILILGSGIAGISASYHFGHERCLMLEKSQVPFGHIGNRVYGDFTFDPGPHVSFTTHDYVRRMFAASVEEQFFEYTVQVGNYYKNSWVSHPALTSLFQFPEDLRDRILKSFLDERNVTCRDAAKNYSEWMIAAFGREFSDRFSSVYTRKYWTIDPEHITTEWLGDRVHSPSVEDVLRGCSGPLEKSPHYISRVRYPQYGGYQAFAKKMLDGAKVNYNSEVVGIDLPRKIVVLANGKKVSWRKLVSTLPLPVFIKMCRDVPGEILEASRALSCTQLFLINVMAPHTTVRPENWIYVYDEDLLSTRIHCVEKLSRNNAPPNHTGIQVEVYASRHKSLSVRVEDLTSLVKAELEYMGLVRTEAKTFTSMSCEPWANVIFHHDTKPALEIIWSWLEEFGLCRERDDTHPLTDWSKEENIFPKSSVVMAGRFAQWKYFWSDDCVLRGRQIAACSS